MYIPERMALAFQATALLALSCSPTPSMDAGRPDASEVTDASTNFDGGTSDAGSSVNDAGSADAGPQTAAVTIDGTLRVYSLPDMPFSASSHLLSGNEIIIQAHGARDDAGYAEGFSATVRFSDDGGVRDCDGFSNPSDFSYTRGGGTSSYASHDARASCSFQISSRPRCPGDWFVGHFTAHLIDFSGQAVDLASGAFAERVVFYLHGSPVPAGCTCIPGGCL